MKASYYIFILSFMISLTFISCLSNRSQKKTSTELQSFDLEKISDGDYTGVYASGSVFCKVQVSVKNHAIISIVVLENKNVPYAKAAEGVIDEVVQYQKLNVDVISGATEGSRYIINAIQNSFIH